MFKVLLRLTFFMTNWRKRLRVDIRDMLRTDASAALDKRCNHLFRRGIAIGAVLGFAADNGFIGLDNLARHRPTGRRSY